MANHHFFLSNFLFFTFSFFKITVNGDLYSFGRNREGQLGVGDFQDVIKPKFILNNPKIKNIILGAASSFYLLSKFSTSLFFYTQKAIFRKW